MEDIDLERSIFFEKINSISFNDSSLYPYFFSAIRALAQNEPCSLKSLTVIWVDDLFLQNLHKKYLNDDSFTDVMTFLYSEPKQDIEAELYISIDRAKENAQIYQVLFEEELCRLIIHGLLHLNGYNDRTEEERRLIREKENIYLSLSK